MGTKQTRESAMKNADKNLSVPPGFVSLTAFTLKRMVADREATDPMFVDVKSDPGIIGAPLSKSEIEKFKSSLVHRPWICCEKSDRIPQKYDTEQTEVDMVTTRWHPEESHLPELDDAPVFRPTEEEFKDTLKYIANIRPRAESCGICRIVPPPSWRPPCLLRDKKTWETTKVNTRVQKIDGLQNFYLKRKLSRLHEKMEAKMQKVATANKHEFCHDCAADTEEAKSSVVMSEFEKGPDLTLSSFKKKADNFKRQYFSENGEVIDLEMGALVPKQKEPLVARVEGEYWRIIVNPSEEIEVLCGTNLASQNLGSAFPTRDMTEYSDSEYVKSGWNLNNITKLPGSLLRFGCYSNSATYNPQLFIGMCFASQCWRTENQHLYSLSYMHMGDPKVWYGIPGSYYFKFVEITKKLFPQLSKHPKLIHELATQISPSLLTSKGIPVYRCVQNPLEFVLIFPGAYHSEFSCGFNSSESVCFAPFDWLPHGQSIVELYAGYGLQTSISHDKLLLGAALEAVSAQWEFLVLKTNSSHNQLWRSVCGKDGVLTKLLKQRIKAEAVRRDYLFNPSQSRSLGEFDVATKRECSICLYDLYLSSVGCSCSPNHYSCPRHAKQLCSCPWGAKLFFFRYRIADLNLLIEALEGNREAIHGWTKRKAQPNAIQQLNTGEKSPATTDDQKCSDAMSSGLSQGSCERNRITSSKNLIPAHNGAGAENKTLGSNHQQEAMAGASSPPDTCVVTGLNTLPACAGQNSVTSPPANVIILLSDDED